jgi:succinyl-diaminopimelate desuccinylase
MKTAIAAYICSAKKFLDETENFNGTISFLLTADEEGDADYGTKSVVEWLKKNNKKIDYCLVGEPTNPNSLGEMIKIGRRGSLNADLLVIGKQGHVAYPEKCLNPIDQVPQICSVLSEKFDEGSSNFQPTKLVITSIDVGNQVTNLVPNKVKLKFNVRFNDKFKSNDIIGILKERLDSIGCKYELSTKVSGESFFNYSEKLTKSVVKAVKKVTTKEPELSTSGGTSDARFISELCPVIEFGIVGNTMHQVNESISVNDIESLSAIYFEFMKNMFDQ